MSNDDNKKYSVRPVFIPRHNQNNVLNVSPELRTVLEICHVKWSMSHFYGRTSSNVKANQSVKIMELVRRQIVLQVGNVQILQNQQNA